VGWRRRGWRSRRAQRRARAGKSPPADAPHRCRWAKQSAADGIGGLLGQDGRSPAAFYNAGREELARYPSVQLLDGDVLRGERCGDGFSLELADGARATARRVVLATGMEYRFPALPGIAERWGRSVFHCPYCHGWEVRGQRLGVLDRGAAGVHRALLLRTWSEHVTLLTDGPSELDSMEGQRLHAAGIPIDERPAVRLHGSDGTIEAVGFDDGTERPLTGMLVPVTLHQRSDLPWQLGAVATDRGPVAADAIQVDAMFQTVPGLYAAGDAVVPQPPSVATAIAAGSTAAACWYRAWPKERVTGHQLPALREAIPDSKPDDPRITRRNEFTQGFWRSGNADAIVCALRQAASPAWGVGTAAVVHQSCFAVGQAVPWQSLPVARDHVTASFAWSSSEQRRGPGRARAQRRLRRVLPRDRTSVQIDVDVC
jgi:thioredoxin reductase